MTQRGERGEREGADRGSGRLRILMAITMEQKEWMVSLGSADRSYV